MSERVEGEQMERERTGGRGTGLGHNGSEVVVVVKDRLSGLVGLVGVASSRRRRAKDGGRSLADGGHDVWDPTDELS